MSGNRFTADGQSSANMTNLAIKGIVAIEAMAQISAVLGNSSAASYYSVSTVRYYLQKDSRS